MTRVLNERFTLTEVEGGAVLLDTKRGEYWQLNPVATLVARRISLGDEARTIVQNLIHQHPDAADRIPRDVDGILRHLEEIGAVSDE